MRSWSLVHPAADVWLWLAATEMGLCRVSFDSDFPERDWSEDPEHPVLRCADQQLTEYFAGQRRSFDVALTLNGTPFQIKVWEALRAIPYGETVSYAHVAKAVGNPKALRAVGAANGRNPVPIIVPCHRVVEAGGRLGGFSSGVENKLRLLDLESGQLAWR